MSVGSMLVCELGEKREQRAVRRMRIRKERDDAQSGSIIYNEPT
jgi:hypothetical protein